MYYADRTTRASHGTVPPVRPQARAVPQKSVPETAKSVPQRVLSYVDLRATHTASVLHFLASPLRAISLKAEVPSLHRSPEVTKRAH